MRLCQLAVRSRVVFLVPWESAKQSLFSGQIQNFPFLENGQFSGHFFFGQKLFLEKNVKYYAEKVLKMFLTLKKSVFGTLFWKKKIKKKFEKIFRH